MNTNTTGLDPFRELGLSAPNVAAPKDIFSGMSVSSSSGVAAPVVGGFSTFPYAPLTAPALTIFGTEGITFANASIPPGTPLRETDPMYSAWSPPLIASVNGGTMNVCIEKSTNDLYLLNYIPYVDGTHAVNRIGKAIILEPVTGDGLIIAGGAYIIKMTRLKDGYILSEMTFSLLRLLSDITRLSKRTPFKRMGHAEYDKLALIFG
jgi:hypothetical protein